MEAGDLSRQQRNILEKYHIILPLVSRLWVEGKQNPVFPLWPGSQPHSFGTVISMPFWLSLVLLSHSGAVWAQALHEMLSPESASINLELLQGHLGRG